MGPQGFTYTPLSSRAVPRPEVPRPFLILQVPGQAPRELDLSSRDHFVLGRQAEGAGVDISLTASHASRVHAIVFLTAEGKAFLQDQGSSNGTFFNEEKLLRGELREWSSNDEVRFGLHPNHEIGRFERRLQGPKKGAKRPREEEVTATAPSQSLQLPKARTSTPGPAVAMRPAAEAAAPMGPAPVRAQSSSQRSAIGPYVGPQLPPKGGPVEGPQLPPAMQRARSMGPRCTEAFAHGAGQVARGAVKCDKCDGPHVTDQCPHFRKAREDHKDAWVNYGSKRPQGIGADTGNFVLRHAQTFKQPGDGSCLFHSLCFGLRKIGLSRGTNADNLRREIAQFILENPHLEISGDTLEEWIRWDANTTSSNYARSMAQRGWGGGIEMAACSRLKSVSVHVYEHNRSGGGFRRISCFDHPQARSTVHVLYQGRMHYDALLPAR